MLTKEEIYSSAYLLARAEQVILDTLAQLDVKSAKEDFAAEALDDACLNGCLDEHYLDLLRAELP